MNKKIAYLLIVTAAMLVMSACSSIKLPGTSATPQAGQQNSGQNQAQGQDFTNMPIEGKLAMGTLMLEGSDYAVTAAQAKELLPLWKAVKSLSSSASPSTEEMNAVYQQIQETLTEQQVQAIKDISLKPEDTQALMTKYNIQMPQMPTMDANRQATRAASSSQSQQGGNSGGPGSDFGGLPPGGMPPDGAMMGDGQPNAQGTPQPQGTPRAGGFRGGGMNTLFVDPLIKLLQERAGA